MSLVSNQEKMPKRQRILILEPFYGGSHQQFIETLQSLSVNYDEVLGDSLPSEARKKPSSRWPIFEFKLYDMKAKKWHWRARTSALYMSQVVDREDIDFDILLVSSVLNLSEFLSLRPDMARIPRKIIYFHENQLVYPVQAQKERDFQYGYNQFLSCLVADQVVFNSKYNQDSFLLAIKPFFKIMPDYRPPNLDDLIRSIVQKSMVLYYPIKLCHVPLMHTRTREKNVLHIIWPHRWEHDKNPESLFRILYSLKEQNIRFKVSVLGESYSQVPAIFDDAKDRLAEEIVNWGYCESKDDFFQVLSTANVALSTSNHEFFGVSMIEAAYCGCYPLCPSRLVYPELFPAHYLYKTEEDCIDRLKQFAEAPISIPMPLDVPFSQIDWTYCRDDYKKLLSPQDGTVAMPMANHVDHLKVARDD